MNRYRFSQLSSGALLRTLDEQAAHERGSTALLVALIAEVEHLLAVRFPKPDVPTVIQTIVPVGTRSAAASPAPGPETLGISQLAPEPVALIAPAIDAASLMGTNGQAVPGTHSVPPARVAPLSAETYRVQFTMRQTTHDKLLRLQDLLGHRVAAGDLDAVLEHAFDAAIEKLEKRKFGASEKPRAGKASSNPRYIPARVKRAVAKRDDNRCA